MLSTSIFSTKSILRLQLFEDEDELSFRVVDASPRPVIMGVLQLFEGVDLIDRDDVVSDEVSDRAAIEFVVEFIPLIARDGDADRTRSGVEAVAD
ncbi:MAG: hypothetical protein ACREEW_14435 [Caulobacteraceae bacterium]